MDKENRYLELAKKIVEGLVNQKMLVYDTTRNDSRNEDVWRLSWAMAISKAMVDELTYGNLGTLTMRDNKGRIVAKLYILPDGTLADDSWTTHGVWTTLSRRVARQ